jgi:heme-degrading monooxygenase HmoA
MNPVETRATGTTSEPAGAAKPAEFVAVNFISCQSDYRERFEMLFKSRAHAIERAPGFHHMLVLKPQTEGGDYLVVSYWDDQAAFDHWRKSPEFAEGHRRGFEDVKKAREAGQTPPMTSRMELYSVLCR